MLAKLLLLLFAAHAPWDVLDSRFAEHDELLRADPASAFWRGAPRVRMDTDNFGKPQPDHQTEVRSRWTEENLYFLFVCRYREMAPLPRAPLAGETNGLWDGDVAEVFIGSDFSNIRKYREFEMSPRGEWLDIDVDLSRPHPADGWTWNSGFEVCAKVDARKKVWYGAMRIPYRAVDARPAAAGNTLRVDFFREQGPEGRRVEIAWKPTLQRSYHAPERFGSLRLIR